MNRFALTVLRQQAGLTQADLATALGVSRFTVTHWEIGTRPMTKRDHIAVSTILRAKLYPPRDEK